MFGKLLIMVFDQIEESTTQSRSHDRVNDELKGIGCGI
jgi:hypothetical protein